ncbi:MAG: hypothetical protein ACYC0V_20985, partial [Armatimonadota bacterium]
SPVVYNNVVYITNEASKVYAFTADNTGAQVFAPISLPIDDSQRSAFRRVTDVNRQNICGASSPAIGVVGSETYLLLGSDDGYVYRIKLSDLSLSAIDVHGCVEASPSISGNNAYVGVSIYNGQDVCRLSIEPFAEIANWKLGEESRATVSLAYDFAYNGVDTGHSFFKLDTNASGNNNIWLREFALRSDHPDYFVGSAAHTTGGIVYTGNDDGKFYALNSADLSSLVSGGYYDGSIQTPGFICSSPAIGYNVDSQHNRWVFITTRADGGKLYAFKTVR